MITIYGHKFKEVELKGTDVSVASEFCKKNKISGAVMIYEDDEGIVAAPISFNKKGDELVNKILDSLWHVVADNHSSTSVQLSVDIKAIKERLKHE